MRLSAQAEETARTLWCMMWMAWGWKCMNRLTRSESKWNEKKKKNGGGVMASGWLPNEWRRWVWMSCVSVNELCEKLVMSLVGREVGEGGRMKRRDSRATHTHALASGPLFSLSPLLRPLLFSWWLERIIDGYMGYYIRGLCYCLPSMYCWASLGSVTHRRIVPSSELKMGFRKRNATTDIRNTVRSWRGEKRNDSSPGLSGQPWTFTAQP